MRCVYRGDSGRVSRFDLTGSAEALKDGASSTQPLDGFIEPHQPRVRLASYRLCAKEVVCFRLASSLHFREETGAEDDPRSAQGHQA